MGFTFLRPSDSRLPPEHRAQFLTIRRLVKWKITDASGTYSGHLIEGEQIIGTQPTPPGLLPAGNMTIDPAEREVSAAKIQELSLMMLTEFAGLGFDVVCFDADFRVQ